MSDHDARDPIDQAYLQAAGLTDDDGRAARRARVLAAVAEAEVAPAPIPRGSLWRRGGWLAAASVAGVSVLLATQLYRPASLDLPAAQPKTPPAATSEVTPQAAAPSAPAQLPMQKATPPPPPQLKPPSGPVAPREAAPELLAVAPSPVAPPVEARASRSGALADEIVVTGSRVEEPTPASSAALSSPEMGARLRAAAASGRTRELTELLAHGVPVDAADVDGETALMIAIEKRQPAAAALLRRYGASLTHRNSQGASASEMVDRAADPGLNRALGLEPD